MSEATKAEAARARASRTRASPRASPAVASPARASPARASPAVARARTDLRLRVLGGLSGRCAERQPPRRKGRHGLQQGPRYLPLQDGTMVSKIGRSRSGLRISLRASGLFLNEGVMMSA